MKYVLMLSALFITQAPGVQAEESGKDDPVRTVGNVDLNRYMGTWYEIAKFPKRFEKGLVGVTATYTMMPGGKVRFVNAGYKENFSGKFVQAQARAWAVDESQSKLKVMFFWPFRDDYWIIGLGKNYEYALVGDPERESLWILSRTPVLDPAVYDEVLLKAKRQGFDISRLIKMPQK